MVKSMSRFETGNIPKLLASFAIPSIVSLIVNAIYNIVDQIFIGQYIGQIGNAATTVMYPLITISLAFSLIVGNGGAAYFSIKLGEKDIKKATATVNTSIVLLLLFGITLTLISLPFCRQILVLFGSTDSIMAYAMKYTPIIICGFPFVMYSVGIAAIIRADGSPKYAMFCMVVGALMNVILDPIFIHTLGFGISGAAIATLISQVSVFILTMYYTVFKFKTVKIGKGYINLTLTPVILHSGMASFLTQLSITAVQVSVNNILTHYGAHSMYGQEIPLAAFGIVMKVSSVFISIILGIGLGAQPLLGYNFGAKRNDRVISIYRYEIFFSTIVALTAWTLFIFFPNLIIPLFGDMSNTLYVRFITYSFRIYFLLYFFVGFQINTSMMFQAIGQPTKSAFLSMSRMIIIFLPIVFTLPLFFGIMGVLYAGPVADGLSALFTLVFLIRELRILKRKEDK